MTAPCLRALLDQGFFDSGAPRKQAATLIYVLGLEIEGVFLARDFSERFRRLPTT